MTVLEAMSIGLPVLAMNTTDLPVVIDDGVEGFLVDSIGDMIKKYNYLIDNLDLIQDMGNNAISKIRTKFSHNRFKTDWDNIFREVGL